MVVITLHKLLGMQFIYYFLWEETEEQGKFPSVVFISEFRVVLTVVPAV